MIVPADCKKVLIVYYSNSGDVLRSLRALVSPIEAAGHDVHWAEIRTKPAFPFPWEGYDFFNVLPETIAGYPPALEAPELPNTQFDLVILGAQVWFLSPSLPIQAFLAAPEAASLRGCRVLLMLSCRQMWRLAHRRLRGAIVACGARHSDTIVMKHRGELISLLTTPHSLLRTKRAKLPLLPIGGLDEDQLAQLPVLGQRVAEASEKWSGADPLITGTEESDGRNWSAIAEWLGLGYFKIWSTSARAAGTYAAWLRKPIMYFFAYLFLLLIPVGLIVSWITSLPARLFLRRAR